ncbi:hypothetical protein [Algivirga pacifica]|uniref:Uncharacterized protein n=1 Tax=Algivirga pacifica TaxID=1162670 RepID=A0ABP9DN75_9BACT
MSKKNKVPYCIMITFKSGPLAGKPQLRKCHSWNRAVFLIRSVYKGKFTAAGIYHYSYEERRVLKERGAIYWFDGEGNVKG